MTHLHGFGCATLAPFHGGVKSEAGRACSERDDLVQAGAATERRGEHEACTEWAGF